MDMSALLQKMQDSKESLIPSIDDFTMTELTNLVDELSHENVKEEKAEGDDQQIDTTGKNDDVKSH